MKTALILPPGEEGFRAVAGLPLLQRLVLSVLRQDFDRIVVVAGDRLDQTRSLLRADARTRGVEISPDFPVLGGAELAIFQPGVFVTPATAQRIASTGVADGAVLFLSQGEAIAARCSVATWNASLATEAVRTAAQAWDRVRQSNPGSVELHDEVAWPVADDTSARRIELAFCERMRRDSAASDGPLAHWVDRRISLFLSRRIAAHTNLRPNHITLIGTSIGLIASALLGVGTYATAIAGTLLFLAATIIDGCDGEVARMKLLDSPFGQKLDVTTDNIVHVTIFLGLALGLYRAQPDQPYLTLIAILLGGFAFDGAVTYFFLVKRPGFASSGGPPATWKGKLRQRLLAGMEAMMNRDFAYLLVLLACADRLHWFLWGAAFGTYGFGILLILVYRWRDAG